MDKSYNRGRYLSNPFIRLQYKSSRKKGKVFLFPILISLINGDDYFELILVNIFSFLGCLVLYSYYQSSNLPIK